MEQSFFQWDQRHFQRSFLPGDLKAILQKTNNQHKKYRKKILNNKRDSYMMNPVPLSCSTCFPSFTSKSMASLAHPVMTFSGVISLN